MNTNKTVRGITLTSMNDVIQVLTDLGLTLSQARVYFVISKSGTCTARTISKKSHIGREHVYEALPQLQELSLVEKILGSPSQFRAIPLQEGLAILHQRRTTKTNELNKQTMEIISNCNNYNVETASQKNDDYFILTPAKTAAINKRRKQIETAQKNIDFIVSFKGLGPIAQKYQKVIEKALERGVKIRVITQKPENVNEISKLVQDFMQHPSLKIRYVIKPPSAVLTIFDSEHVVINTSPEKPFGESSGLWSNNHSLIVVMKDYYELMWITAIEDIQEFPVLKDPQIQV